MKIDLFNLVNEAERKPKSWIMAKGSELNDTLEPLILELAIRFGSKIKLTKYFQNKFGISPSTSQRFVFLMKEWHPLPLIKEVVNLTKSSIFEIQDKIDFLKVNQPPLKVYNVVRELTEDLCKIAGAHAADGTINNNFFRITDGYKSNIIAFKCWIERVFGVEYPIKKVSENEWAIEFHSKIISSYLRKIFGFPSGIKQYIVTEPEIIKKASLKFRKSFALGALTFEAGIGIKTQIELCVASKEFKDSIAEILTLSKVRFVNMKNKSGEYWRLWSNKLSEEESKKWMEFFEPNTEKWFELNDYVYGFEGKVNSFEDAVKKLNNIYPSKSASKICLKDILFIIKDLKVTYRYELASYLCKSKNLNSYGGKWAHSLAPYLDILQRVKIVSIEKRKFGKKKSFGSIVREIYIYNPKISEWRVPERPC